MQCTKFSIISSDYLKFFPFFFTATKTSLKAILLARFYLEQHVLCLHEKYNPPSRDPSMWKQDASIFMQDPALPGRPTDPGWNDHVK